VAVRRLVQWRHARKQHGGGGRGRVGPHLLILTETVSQEKTWGFFFASCRLQFKLYLCNTFARLICTLSKKPKEFLDSVYINKNAGNNCHKARSCSLTLFQSYVQKLVSVNFSGGRGVS
jgi:hypothetical protein